MWSKSKCGRYRVDTIDRYNFNGALEVIREAFCRDEAVCVGSEVDRSAAAAEELLELCADTALDGVSLVCTCARTGSPVAVSFNKIQVTREAFCRDEAVCVGSEVDRSAAAAEELLELCADTALDGVSLVCTCARTGSPVTVSFNKIQVTREAFCRDEAVCVGSEVDRSAAAAEELLELCADTALDGVSLVCTCARTGSPVTVSFNKIQVTREAFCRDEAVCVGSEVDRSAAAAEELLELCADTALDGVSLVCTCARTGSPVAVSFNKIQVTREAFCREEAVCVGSEVDRSAAAAEELLELCADTALDGVSLVCTCARTGSPVAVSFNKIQVTREVFCRDEAVCVGSEVDRSAAAAEELLELCADTALDGVSLVCTCARTGSPVAVSFNKIQVTREVASSDTSEESFFDRFARERCKEPSAQSLIRFMSTVDAKYNLFEKYNVDCSLEIMFLATLKEHRGKGLGVLLTQESLKLAAKLHHGPVSTMTVADLGPKYCTVPARYVETEKTPKICQALFTSWVSQKVGKRAGFTVDAVVSYEDFFHNGKTYAERIGPESPNCELVSKMIRCEN